MIVYIPNCRTDEYYNESTLSTADKTFVKGYDFCASNTEIDWECFLDDFDIEGEDINLARFMLNHKEIADTLDAVVKYVIESNRNGLIVGIIDNYEEI